MQKEECPYLQVHRGESAMSVHRVQLVPSQCRIMPLFSWPPTAQPLLESSMKTEYKLALVGLETVSHSMLVHRIIRPLSFTAQASAVLTTITDRKTPGARSSESAHSLPPKQVQFRQHLLPNQNSCQAY